MRSDMQKVIVSRPRVGGKRRKNTKQGGREPMRPRGFYVNKEQTDLLSPLKRFLQKQTGQIWNDVWSEICQQTDSRSVIGNHLRSHVLEMVRKPTLGEDGRLYEDGRVYTCNSYFHEFYVDPRDNKLYAAAVISRKTPRKNSVKKVFELDGVQFHQYDGLWYRVEMREVPESWWQDASIQYRLPDKFLNYLIGDGWYIRSRLQDEYGMNSNGMNWYCISKKSANHKEVKKIKVLIP